MSTGIAEATEVIGSGLYNWLEAEVESSMKPDDRNSYLDMLEQARDNLALGFDNGNNQTVAKHKSHIDRFPVWWMGFQESLKPDFADEHQRNFQAARISFHGLMEVSGTYRNQCYTQAQDQADYENRRRGVIGIDIEKEVATRLQARLPKNGDFRETGLTFDDLGFMKDLVTDIGDLAIKMLCDRAEQKLDFGKEESESAKLMQWAQRHWLGFAVDSIVYVTKVRDGELAAVPMLEARSISDVSRIDFPFTQAA